MTFWWGIWKALIKIRTPFPYDEPIIIEEIYKAHMFFNSFILNQKDECLVINHIHSVANGLKKNFSKSTTFDMKGIETRKVVINSSLRLATRKHLKKTSLIPFLVKWCLRTCCPPPKGDWVVACETVVLPFSNSKALSLAIALNKVEMTLNSLQLPRMSPSSLTTLLKVSGSLLLIIHQNQLYQRPHAMI